MTDDDSRRVILARRARFIAAALASAGLAANPACGGEVEDGNAGAGGGAGQRDAANDQPQACLSMGGTPQVCLSPPGGTSGFGGVGGAPFDGPVPCLDLPIDASSEPVPCLSPPFDAEAPDADASDDAVPQPCLVPPASSS